jgi:tetratricopeptide (TPR) repeat protein
MQTSRFFLFVLFLSIAFLDVDTAVAQDYFAKVKTADSLFRQRKYTESFELFDEVLTKDKYFTYRMLLQMAYIKEGMNDYASALFYLNTYYAYNPEQKVLDKISELAAKNKLNGYETNDVEYLMALYRQNQVAIIVFVFSLFIVFLAYLTYRKFRGKDILYPSIALSFALAIFFLLFNYYGIDLKKGIVKNDKVFLMNFPSAGGELVNTLQKGDCVMITDQTDVWYKVKWKDQEAYIRASSVYLVQ